MTIEWYIWFQWLHMLHIEWCTGMTIQWCHSGSEWLWHTRPPVYYHRPSVSVSRKEGRMIINEVGMLLEWIGHTRPSVYCHRASVSQDDVRIMLKRYQNDIFPMGDGFQFLLILHILLLWPSAPVVYRPWLMSGRIGSPFPPPPFTSIGWGIIGWLWLTTQWPENDIVGFNIGWNLAFFTGPNFSSGQFHCRCPSMP